MTKPYQIYFITLLLHLHFLLPISHYHLNYHLNVKQALEAWQAESILTICTWTPIVPPMYISPKSPTFTLSQSLNIFVVQLLSHMQLFVIPWAAAHQASLSFTISQSLLKLLSIESVMPSIHLVFCCPLLLLPSIFPSPRGFSNELALHIRWSKYWSFSTSPSNEYSGLISFRIDWFDLPTGQGTLKSLLSTTVRKH